LALAGSDDLQNIGQNIAKRGKSGFGYVFVRDLAGCVMTIRQLLHSRLKQRWQLRQPG